MQSQAAYGFADAKQHFETALELWDQVADPEQPRLSRARVLRHAAESAYPAGDPDRAITLIRAALAAGRRGRGPGPGRAAARAARRLPARDRWPGGDCRVRGGRTPGPPRAASAERAEVLAAFGEALIGRAAIATRGRCARRRSQLPAVGARRGGRRPAGAGGGSGLPRRPRGGHRAAARPAGSPRRSPGSTRSPAATHPGRRAGGVRLEAAATVAVEGAEVADSQGLGRWHSPFLAATAARALFALGRWDEAEAMLRQAVTAWPRSWRPPDSSTRPAASSTSAGVGSSRPPSIWRWPMTPIADRHPALVRGAAVRRDGRAGAAGGPLADADTAVAEGLQVPRSPRLAAPLYTRDARGG